LLGSIQDDTELMVLLRRLCRTKGVPKQPFDVQDRAQHHGLAKVAFFFFLFFSFILFFFFFFPL